MAKIVYVERAPSGGLIVHERRGKCDTTPHEIPPVPGVNPERDQYGQFHLHAEVEYGDPDMVAKILEDFQARYEPDPNEAAKVAAMRRLNALGGRGHSISRDPRYQRGI